MFLDVHLEYCDDKGERLRGIAELDKPFSISLVPVLLLPEHSVFKTGVYPSDYYYPKEIIGVLRELAGNSNITWSQQGFLHYCPECFMRKERKDPWHENRCLYGKRKSVEEQIGFMETGMKVMREVLGVSPLMYATPNHQYDDNTKEAAEMLGYRYFADRAILNIPPYIEAESNLIILPERKPRQEGNIFYTHYDQIPEDLDFLFRCLEIVKASEPLENLVAGDKSIVVSLNSWLNTRRKRLRDVKKHLRI